MAAVLLRTQMDPSRKLGGGYETLSQHEQAQFRAQLLAALSKELSLPVGRMLCHVVAQVAKAAAGPGFSQWPDLLNTVFSMAQNQGNPAIRRVAMFLFKELVAYTGVAGIGPHAAALKPVLAGLLNDPSPPVAALALAGVAKVILILPDELRSTYLDLMPSALAVLERTLSPGGDESVAREALLVLVDIVLGAPAFMRDFLQPAANAMLTIINHEGLDDE